MKKGVVIGIIIGILVSGMVAYAASTISSSVVAYDNSKSGLTATNVKDAVDELSGKASYLFNEAYFALTYDNNGGTGCTNKIAKYGETWGELCVPTRLGYEFSGWTGVTETTKVTKAITATANWTLKPAYNKSVGGANGWSAVYKCEGGVGTMIQCSYYNGVVCTGEGEFSPYTMCTMPSWDYIPNTNGRCRYSMNLTNAYGGGLSYQISC